CVAMGALPDDLAAAVAPLLGALPPSTPLPVPPPLLPARRAPSRAREAVPMLQAKVVLVLRMPPPPNVAAHCALMTCLSLWGGGAHSRLFKEVRERRSLCYYAAAAGDPRKGLATVQIGCDERHLDAVVAESLRQLDELAAGRFGDDELAATTATIAGSLAAVDDSLTSR